MVVGMSLGGGRAKARWRLKGRERRRKASSSSSADSSSRSMLGSVVTESDHRVLKRQLKKSQN